MTDRTINWVFRATDKTSQAFRSIDSRLAGITKSLKTFAGFAGFATVAAGIGTLTRDLVQLGSELSDVSAKLGVSAESVQVLKFAAEQTGASFDQLQSALQFNTKLAGEATRGNKEAAETFRLLGLDAKKFSDLPIDRRLATIAQQLSQVQDPALRLDLTLKALGRSGADLAPLLAEGAGGLAKFEAQLRSTNSILSDEQVKALDDAGDAWEAFSLRLKVKVSPLFTGLLATLTEAGNLLTGQSKIFQQSAPDKLFYDNLQGINQGPSSRRRGRPPPPLSEEEAAAVIGIPGKKSTEAALASFAKAFAEVDRISAKALKATNAEMAQLQAETDAVVEGIARLGAEANSTFSDRAAEIKAQFADPLEVLKAQVLEINQLFAGGLIDTGTANRAVQEYADSYASAIGTVGDKSEEVKTSTQEMFEALKLAADGFARDLTDVFFDSTNSIGDMFEKLAETIAKALFTQTVSEPLIQGILGAFNFGGARAAGGPVRGGTSYLVGERGPELFVPGSSGSIVPNGAGGGVSIVNNFSVNSLDPQTAAQVLVANERLLTGMTRRAMQRAGVRPPLA